MKNARTESLARIIKQETGAPVVVEAWTKGLIIHAASEAALSKATSWMLTKLRMVDPDACVDRVVDASNHAPADQAFFALVVVSWTQVKAEGPGVIERHRSIA